MLPDDPKDDEKRVLCLIKIIIALVIRMCHCNAAATATGVFNILSKLFWISTNILFRAILSIPVIPIKVLKSHQAAVLCFLKLHILR